MASFDVDESFECIKALDIYVLIYIYTYVVPGKFMLASNFALLISMRGNGYFSTTYDHVLVRWVKEMHEKHIQINKLEMVRTQYVLHEHVVQFLRPFCE